MRRVRPRNIRSLSMKDVSGVRDPSDVSGVREPADVTGVGGLAAPYAAPPPRRPDDLGDDERSPFELEQLAEDFPELKTMRRVEDFPAGNDERLAEDLPDDDRQVVRDFPTEDGEHVDDFPELEGGRPTR